MSESSEIDYERLAGLVAEKLGPTERPATSDDAVASALQALAGATAKTYQDPGAPSGAPPESLDRDPTRWSRDYIDRLRSDGTFMAEIQKFRDGLPGGSNGLFRKRIPGGRR